jgi:hypothetical protein
MMLPDLRYVWACWLLSSLVQFIMLGWTYAVNLGAELGDGMEAHLPFALIIYLSYGAGQDSTNLITLKFVLVMFCCMSLVLLQLYHQLLESLATLKILQPVEFGLHIPCVTQSISQKGCRKYAIFASMEPDGSSPLSSWYGVGP